ncbi:uncharacterized protein [Periplaneta americana]|uniref:uncharacterized protein n=1 Tax=Periplaneta americana TaxID=6978 RepID=UPI0037E897B3
MNCHYRFVIWFVCLFALESISAADSTPCQMNVIATVCTDPNESCHQIFPGNSTGVCKCKSGYSRQSVSDLCMLDSTSTQSPRRDNKSTTSAPDHSAQMSDSTVAASVLVPLVLIVAVAGLIYSAWRYRWLQRLQQRRYDEVRIGQEDDDDPPIA